MERPQGATTISSFNMHACGVADLKREVLVRHHLLQLARALLPAANYCHLYFKRMSTASFIYFDRMLSVLILKYLTAFTNFVYKALENIGKVHS